MYFHFLSNSPAVSLMDEEVSLRSENCSEELESQDESSYKKVVLGSTLGFFLFGYDTGVVSGASKWMQKDLNMTTFEKGVAVGITCIMAAFSCMFAGPLNERFGRRKSIMLSSVLFTIGACGMVLCEGTITATLSRACLGLAIGIATTSVPLYVAECVPPSNRGQLLILNDFSIAVGQVAAGLCNVYFRGHGHNWRASMGLAAVPAILQLILFLSLPESPRWLVSKGRSAEACAVFGKLMGTSPEAKQELQQIITKNEDGEHDLGFFEMWRNSKFTGVLIVGIILQVMNQASGINTVMYYSASILEHSGFEEEHAIWGAVACTVTQTAGVSLSITKMDVWGRRFLIILSSAMVAPFISMLATCFAFIGVENSTSDVITSTMTLSHEEETTSLLLRMLVVGSLAGYLFSFGLGLSGVPWTMNAEIYPHTIRNKGQAQATFTNWFLNGIIAILFPVFMDTSTTAAVVLLFFFGCVAVTGCVWFYYYLPETMHLTLEEIEDLFSIPLRQAVLKGSCTTDRPLETDHPQLREDSQVEMKIVTEKV